MSVEVETQGGVTLVTLRRPGVRNAVDAGTAHALHAAFVAFEQDDSAHVAVFQGAGGHFCAGWDLQSGARLLADGVTPEALADTLDFTADTVHPPGPMGPSRLQLSKPVIAAIEGAAAGLRHFDTHLHPFSGGGLHPAVRRRPRIRPGVDRRGCCGQAGSDAKACSSDLLWLAGSAFTSMP